MALPTTPAVAFRLSLNIIGMEKSEFASNKLRFESLLIKSIYHNKQM